MIRRPQFWNPVQRYGEKMSKTGYVIVTRNSYVTVTRNCYGHNKKAAPYHYETAP